MVFGFALNLVGLTAVLAGDLPVWRYVAGQLLLLPLCYMFLYTYTFPPGTQHFTRKQKERLQFTRWVFFSGFVLLVDWSATGSTWARDSDIRGFLALLNFGVLLFGAALYYQYWQEGQKRKNKTSAKDDPLGLGT